jgi:hypothetical protein
MEYHIHENKIIAILVCILQHSMRAAIAIVSSDLWFHIISF